MTGAQGLIDDTPVGERTRSSSGFCRGPSGNQSEVALKNEVAGRVVILAAPFFWDRYRRKVYVVVGVVGGLLVTRQVIKRVRRRKEDHRDGVRDRMIAPLPSDQRASPTPTAEAFVDSDRRDE